MDLRRLSLFLAVVDHGGFSAAAREVHVAQPAVSLAVRELERELGAELLVRSRQGATLTAAGEALVGPARQALRDIDIGAAAVAAVVGLRGGRLDVAALPTLAADPVAGLIGAFRVEHPEVQVRVISPDRPDELAAAVRSGEAELGVTERGPVNEGLEQVSTADQPLMAVEPPGRPGDGRVLSLERLATEPLVLTPVGSSLRDVLDRALDAAGLQPTVAVETEIRDALIPLVLAGAGTAVVPPAIAQTAAAQGAAVRPLRPRLVRQVVVVHRAGAHSPAASEFLAAVMPR